MPSFPGSVISFTAKTAGQNIDSAHVNDLQDEVNAIEAGFLNGTARLNSSASTLASLSVTGGSTLANRPVMPPPDAALVTFESTVTIGSSDASTLAWTRQTFVVNSSMHSTTTNPARLSPQSTGLYRFDAQVSFGAASSGSRTLAIVDSTGDQVALTRRNNAMGEAISLHAGGFKRFDALGGWALARISMSSVSTLSLSSGTDQAFFAMVKQ